MSRVALGEQRKPHGLKQTEKGAKDKAKDTFFAYVLNVKFGYQFFIEDLRNYFYEKGQSFLFTKKTQEKPLFVRIYRWEDGVLVEKLIIQLCDTTLYILGFKTSLATNFYEFLPPSSEFFYKTHPADVKPIIENSTYLPFCGSYPEMIGFYWFCRDMFPEYSVYDFLGSIPFGMHEMDRAVSNLCSEDEKAKMDWPLSLVVLCVMISEALRFQPIYEIIHSSYEKGTDLGNKVHLFQTWGICSKALTILTQPNKQSPHLKNQLQNLLGIAKGNKKREVIRDATKEHRRLEQEEKKKSFGEQKQRLVEEKQRLVEEKHRLVDEKQRLVNVIRDSPKKIAQIEKESGGADKEKFGEEANKLIDSLKEASKERMKLRQEEKKIEEKQRLVEEKQILVEEKQRLEQTLVGVIQDEFGKEGVLQDAFVLLKKLQQKEKEIEDKQNMDEAVKNLALHLVDVSVLLDDLELKGNPRKRQHLLVDIKGTEDQRDNVLDGIEELDFFSLPKKIPLGDFASLPRFPKFQTGDNANLPMVEIATRIFVTNNYVCQVVDENCQLAIVCISSQEFLLDNAKQQQQTISKLLACDSENVILCIFSPGEKEYLDTLDTLKRIGVGDTQKINNFVMLEIPKKKGGRGGKEHSEHARPTIVEAVDLFVTPPRDEKQAAKLITKQEKQEAGNGAPMSREIIIKPICPFARDLGKKPSRKTKTKNKDQVHDLCTTNPASRKTYAKRQNLILKFREQIIKYMTKPKHPPTNSERCEDEQIAQRRVPKPMSDVERRLSLFVSKVFYNVGKLRDSLFHALMAFPLFVLSEDSDHVRTLIAKAIYENSKVKAAEANDGSAIEHTDLEMEAILDSLVDKEGKIDQAIGKAIEWSQFHTLEQSVKRIEKDPFTKEVLSLLVKVYAQLQMPDYLSMCHCHMFLNEPNAVSLILGELLQSHDLDKTLLAFQIAFALLENEQRAFLLKVKDQLSSLKSQPTMPLPSDDVPMTDGAAQAESDPSLFAERLSKMQKILSGETSNMFNRQILKNNHKFNIHQLENIKKCVEMGKSECERGTTYAHAILLAGTTHDDSFGEILGRATDWDEFVATAGLGVIHYGQLQIIDRLKKLVGVDKPPYSAGGALYALGLVHVNQGEGVKEFLQDSLRTTNNGIVQYGACLGLGLAALATSDNEIFGKIKKVLESNIACEVAGVSMGLLMVGAGNEKAEMFGSHENRGVAFGKALTCYGREEGVDKLIYDMTRSKSPITRYGGMFALALAYIGTFNDKAIAHLLYQANNDVSDDVRQTAALALGFVMYSDPEQAIQQISELPEKVRFGAAMALGISCAGSGLSEAISLLEEWTKDDNDTVREGAQIAMAMVMIHTSEASDSRVGFRRQLEEHTGSFGATIASGILDAGGKIMSIKLQSKTKQDKMTAIVGLAVFCQFRYWKPLVCFISLALSPTALVGLDHDLNMLNIDFGSSTSDAMQVDSTGEQKSEPQQFEILSNPARVVPGEENNIKFFEKRYAPVVKSAPSRFVLFKELPQDE